MNGTPMLQAFLVLVNFKNPYQKCDCELIEIDIILLIKKNK